MKVIGSLSRSREQKGRKWCTFNINANNPTVEGRKGQNQESGVDGGNPRQSQQLVKYQSRVKCEKWAGSRGK